MHAELEQTRLKLDGDDLTDVKNFEIYLRDVSAALYPGGGLLLTAVFQRELLIERTRKKVARDCKTLLARKYAYGKLMDTLEVSLLVFLM